MEHMAWKRDPHKFDHSHGDTAQKQIDNHEAFRTLQASDSDGTALSDISWARAVQLWRNINFRKLLIILLCMAIALHTGNLWHSWLHSLFRNQIGHNKLHFSKPRGLEDGPYGLFIDLNATWHLYYQHSSHHGCCSNWNHATSKDLYQWTTQSDAILCKGNEISGGPIIVDRNDTSGLFPGQNEGVIAIYEHYDVSTKSRYLVIAHSTDGGFTFTKHRRLLYLPEWKGNERPRDLKIVWHEQSQRWIMTVASFAAIDMYTSPNLLDWTLTSTFTTTSLRGPIYAASLISLPRIETTGAKVPNWPTEPGGDVKDYGDWIMIISSANDKGHSTTWYSVVKFNGTHVEMNESVNGGVVDFGPDYFGSQFFYGLSQGSPVVSLALASNLKYMQEIPAVVTGPRESYLIHSPSAHGADANDLVLISRPYRLDSLKHEVLAELAIDNTGEERIPFDKDEAVLVDIKMMMQPATDAPVEIPFGISFTSSESGATIFCSMIFNTWTMDLLCDRSLASLPSIRINQMSTSGVRSLLPFHNPAVRRWQVQLILDSDILEVYINGGVQVGTMGLWSGNGAGFDGLTLKAERIQEWSNLRVQIESLRPNC